MATVKKYNLAGVGASVELGKQGSYIAGNASAIGFYTSGDALQKIAIANATAASHAVTKAQLDDISGDLVNHITIDVEHDSGSANLATIASGSRIVSVTVDVLITLLHTLKLVILAIAVDSLEVQMLM
jgi:hypothetical protein